MKTRRALGERRWVRGNVCTRPAPHLKGLLLGPCYTLPPRFMNIVCAALWISGLLLTHRQTDCTKNTTWASPCEPLLCGGHSHVTHLKAVVSRHKWKWESATLILTEMSSPGCSLHVKRAPAHFNPRLFRNYNWWPAPVLLQNISSFLERH